MIVHHVITSLERSYGGPVLALQGLTKAQKAFSQVRISHQLPSTSSVEIDGEIVAASKMSRFDRRANFAIASTAIGEADIVHIHGLWEEIQFAFAKTAEKMNRPYIIRTCGMLDPWSLSHGSKWKKRIYLALRLNRMLKQADAIHFTTSEEAQLARKFVRQEQIIIEPNGIDSNKYRSLPVGGTWRRTLPVADKRLVLFLGRLTPKKGLDLLLRAIERQPELSNLHLMVAGPDEGGYQEYLEQLVSELQLDNRVHFVGMLDDKQKMAAYVDADLFALTSHQENFGNTVLEAMACGTPVLISDSVNLATEVAGSKAGIVTSLEVEDIGRNLRQLLADRKVLSDIGRRGRTLALNHFDWSQIANRWSNHYQKIVHQKRLSR